jgi:GNAT superfamily N-acetyltransferase
MIVRIAACLYKFLELCRENGLLETLSRVLKFTGVIIPVERDLTQIEPHTDVFEQTGVEMVEISSENFHEYRSAFQLRNRYFKALKYLDEGYRAFALFKEGKIFGDVWYSTNKTAGGRFVHCDLDMLGITLQDDEVYMFDMYVRPIERGKALAAPLLGNAGYDLGQQGYVKAFGYFVEDNVPALWVHRVLKYKELPKLRLQQFLGFSRVTPN